MFSWGVTAAAANHFSLDQRDGDSVRLDGETRYLKLGLRRRVGERWLVGLELPWVQHSPGSLDSLIDRWHDWFGLPNGGRETRPKDQLEFSYSNDGAVVFDISEGVSGLGDLSLGAGRLLGERWLVWADVKLPTGKAERLTGNGTTGVSLSITRRGAGRWWQRSAEWYWGVAATYAGHTRLPRADNEPWITRAMGGVTYQLFSRVAFKGQLEVASAQYRGRLAPLADPAVMLALGAEVRLGRRSALDLVIVEDLSVNASPDVVFIINLKNIN